MVQIAETSTRDVFGHLMDLDVEPDIVTLDREEERRCKLSQFFFEGFNIKT